MGLCQPNGRPDRQGRGDVDGRVGIVHQNGRSVAHPKVGGAHPTILRRAAGFSPREMLQGEGATNVRWKAGWPILCEGKGWGLDD